MYTLCARGVALVVLTYFAGRARRSPAGPRRESALMAFRVRTFEHIHQLSIAEQTEEKRGVFVARVTADVDILGQFMEWGGVSWFIRVRPDARRGWR